MEDTLQAPNHRLRSWVHSGVAAETLGGFNGPKLQGTLANDTTLQRSSLRATGRRRSVMASLGRAILLVTILLFSSTQSEGACGLQQFTSITRKHVIPQALFPGWY